MSSPAVDDTVDEVKVFRSNDVDEVLDTAQSSQQLSEDKKDVAYETEMDAPTSNINPQNLFFNPALFSSTMFNQVPMTNLYPVFLQQAALSSPHFNRIMGPPSVSLLSPNFSALSMCSPTYPKPAGFSPAAFMVPQANLLAQNFTNQMTAQNIQKLIAHQQQMQNNARNAENVNPNGHHIPTPKRDRVPREKKDKNHIKKPCNAFLIYLQENRKRFSNGSTVKQSSEVNKEMGKAWHALSKEEQEKYFERAKEAREKHAKEFPNWSARENYAINKKNRRKKRERSLDPNGDNGEGKKCRARFGIENQNLWCKHCKRKKRCLNVRSSDSPVVSSTTNPTTPSHMFASPSSAMSGSSMMSPASLLPF